MARARVGWHVVGRVLINNGLPAPSAHISSCLAPARTLPGQLQLRAKLKAAEWLEGVSRAALPTLQAGGMGNRGGVPPVRPKGEKSSWKRDEERAAFVVLPSPSQGIASPSMSLCSPGDSCLMGDKSHNLGTKRATGGKFQSWGFPESGGENERRSCTIGSGLGRIEEQATMGGEGAAQAVGTVFGLWQAGRQAAQERVTGRERQLWKSPQPGPL